MDRSTDREDTPEGRGGDCPVGPDDPTGAVSPDSSSGERGSSASFWTAIGSPSVGGEEGPELLPGDRVAGRYEVLGRLGRGGMGSVYRARDHELRIDVALKFLRRRLDSPADVERLRDEVRLARRVRHRNVCAVHDIGEADGRPFLSMELVEGDDLARVLRLAGAPRVEKGLDIARQIARGLVAAHAEGVVHRDLKPANVLVDGAGHAKITDFGLAILSDDAIARREIAGTPVYMAPEQRAGEAVTERSDVYAFGLILVELFSGLSATTPGGEKLVERLRRAESGEIDPEPLAPGLEPRVESFVRRAVDVDPQRRPASARELLEAIGEPKASDSTRSVAAIPWPDVLPWLERFRPPSTRQRLGVLFAALAALAALPIVSDFAGRLPSLAVERASDALVQAARDAATNAGAKERFETWGLAFEPGAEVAAAALRLWYRSSDRPVVPLAGWRTRASVDDPPASGANERLVVVDSAGDVVATERDAAVAGPRRDPLPLPFPMSSTPQVLLYCLLSALALGSVAAFARRHLRSGIADREGARRLALFLFAASTASALLGASHAPDVLAEVSIAYRVLVRNVFYAMLWWLSYLALEPWVRRRRPLALVSWKSLLMGRWQEPRVGWDVLCGAAAGVGFALVSFLTHLGEEPVVSLARLRLELAPEALLGARQTAAVVVGTLGQSLDVAFSVLLALFLLSLALGDRRLVALAFVAGSTAFVALGLASIGAAIAVAVLSAGVVLVARLGVLASVSALWTLLVLLRLPVTSDGGAWYFGHSLLALTLVGAVLIASARIASGTPGGEPNRLSRG